MRKFNVVLVIVLIYYSTASATGANVGAGARRLNNLVLEYVNTSLEAPKKDYLDSPFKTFEIDHFRNGWIFIRGQAQGGTAYVTIDSENKDERVLVLGKSPSEAMSYVSKGKHRINVFIKGNPKVSSLIVRSIPMILISEISFAVQSKERPANGYNRVRWRPWEFYQKYILPNVNVIASDRAKITKHIWRPYAEEVRRQGKKWLYKKSINWDHFTKPNAVDLYYEDLGKPLEETPYLDGILLDEWTDSETRAAAYPIFAKVYDRIATNPACKGKKIYQYGLYRPFEFYKPGMESLIRNRFPYMLESYIYLAGEGDSEGDLAGRVASVIGGIPTQWDPKYPGLIKNNMAVVLAMWNYCSSADQRPDMNHQVYLDMQFHCLANHPSLAGLYGIHPYVTRATTDNMLKYVSALLRHYCIEGKRERFNPASLALPHLKNPGFEDGLSGWDVQPVEPNSVKSVLVKDLPFERRHWIFMPPTGSKAIVTVRSAKGPNVISQKIRELKPGHLYSLTMYNMDLSDLFHWKIIPFSIRLDNVEELADLTEDRDITTQYYKDKKMRTANYHFRVFRAKGSEATLTFSDWLPGWQKPDYPVSQVAHEIMWDHIKVQPYYDGDPTTR